MKLHNSTDRIEKEIVLRAPRSRVWRALADAEEFGAWFGIKLEGTFAPGARAHGQFELPGHGNVTVEIAIERMDPETRMSYRWHPYAFESGVDYSSEPTTLVEFQLEEVAEGTRLTVVESGFDGIPAARRAEAFRMNDAGWAAGEHRAICQFIAPPGARSLAPPRFLRRSGMKPGWRWSRD